MVNTINPYNFNMSEANSSMISVLIRSTQLAANYDMWSDNETIQEIIDINKNYFCKMLKNCHPYLDDKSVKCIALSMLLHMYQEITKFTGNFEQELQANQNQENQ
jgi:hypothetical protein